MWISRKYSAGPVDGMGTCYSPPSRFVAPGCPTVASACNKEYNDILGINIKPLNDYKKNRNTKVFRHGFTYFRRKYTKTCDESTRYVLYI
jgi:hypothetical protein